MGWRTGRVPLQRVLQTLGSVTRTIMAYGRKDIPYVEIGHIEEARWHRFLALSNKVTRITVDCGLSEASLERITLAKQTFIGDPFSRLRTLTMGIDDGEHKAVSCVTAPSLTHVCLRCTHFEDDALAWVTDTLPEIAPSITHLRIMSPWIENLGITRYSALQHLDLRCRYVTPRFWESLASCRLLATIILVYCLEIEVWGEEWREEYVHFPALRTFKIRQGHHRVTLTAITRSHMPMLECLSWDSRTRPRNDRVQGPVVAHLKLHSPKIDIERMYALNDGDDGTTDLDNDDDCW